MAPILSKVAPPPPQSPQEAAALAYRKARPLLNSFLTILRETIENGHFVYGEGVKKLSMLSDRAVAGMTRILTNYCCMDLKKFTRGPDPSLTGSLPILFVLMLLLMLYNAFVIGYMPAAGIALNSPTSLLFHAFIFLVFASFMQAVRTDPGSIPNGMKWRTFGSPPPDLKERKHSSDAPRWCRKSQAYKPDRAHFCRSMQKPVLRMDHHCPWIGNTVGHGNHKFFFLFLMYTAGACAFLGVSLVQLLVQATLPALTTFLLIGAGGLTLLLSAILIPFFLFHSWLLVRNMTTIEFCETMRATREGGHEFPHSAYDTTVYENICSVLGENPLLWFLPLGGPPGDGIHFKTKHDMEVEDPSGSAGAAEAQDEEVMDDPEAAHPAACDSSNFDSGPGEDSLQSAEAPSMMEDCSNFLVWHSAADFVDDVRVGCEVIEETFEQKLAQLGACFMSRTKGKARNLICSGVSGASRQRAGKFVQVRRFVPLLGSESSGSCVSGAEFLSS